MFVPRQTISNPFLQFFGGTPYLAPAMFHPIQPVPGLIPTQGINPIGGVPLSAINQLLATHFQPSFALQPGFGQSLQATPAFAGTGQIEAQQLSGLVPFLGPTQWGTPFAGGSGLPGSFGVAGQGALGQGFINPGITDPVTSYLIAQQLNPAAHQLPVRPLIGAQNWSPIQSLYSVGSPLAQVIDPHLAMAQAQLISSLTANPYQQLFRNYAGPSWIPAAGMVSAGQAFPFAQTGV